MSRAPLTLSREMKLGLIALLMLALLGGWLAVNNRRTADTTTQTTTPPGTTATTQDTGQDGTPSGVPAAAGTATGSEVVTAPPFPVTDPNGSTPDPSVPTPLPSGINPDTPLLGLNGHNPFRPAKLDESAAAPTSAITASAPENTVTAPGVTITPPSSSAAQINSALATTGNGGAIPVAPLPGTSPRSGGTDTTAAGSSTSTGVVPITSIPGAKVNVSEPTIPTSPPIAAGSSNTGSSATRPGTTPSSGNSQAGQSAQQNRPAVPPITAVREPAVNIPGVLEQPASAAPDAPSSTPGTPQAITDTGTGTPAQGDQTAAVQTPISNELETYIKEHQVVFDAAVLGPVNTAILRSDKGFFVATVGQPIPDTKVIVKEVTASTATLALNQETVTLQLDKR